MVGLVEIENRNEIPDQRDGAKPHHEATALTERHNPEDIEEVGPKEMRPDIGDNGRVFELQDKLGEVGQVSESPKCGEEPGFWIQVRVVKQTDILCRKPADDPRLAERCGHKGGKEDDEV